MAASSPVPNYLSSALEDYASDSQRNAGLSEPLTDDNASQRPAMPSSEAATGGAAPVDDAPAGPALRGAFAPPVTNKWVDEQGVAVENNFVNFFRSFVEPNSPTGSPYYIQLLNQLAADGQTTLLVDFYHVRSFSYDLAALIAAEYCRFEPFILNAAQKVALMTIPTYIRPSNDARELRKIHVGFLALKNETMIRNLSASLVGELTTVTGTVTRTSVVRPELVSGTFQCTECQAIYRVEQQFVYTEPSRCTNALCNNAESWKLLVDQSVFVDWQKVRIQENSNEIPPGSMPRSLEVIVRHEMCERPKPGDKCMFTGTLLAIPDATTLMLSGRHTQMQKAFRDKGRQSKDSGIGGQGVRGLKTLGCREMTYRLSFCACSAQTSHDKYGHFFDDNNPNINRSEYISTLLSPQEREEMLQMIDSPTNYQDLYQSIAPTVFGHDRIKEGIMLMLLGGVHKVTPEGTNKLRGDINVCIVGDPGLSKSQFLKYVAAFLPRGVYTSGKSSSAAGLTASVIKDEETGDFTIEAGALMLADNGICCIDEFDKMDIKDQVAIHEAMEQQTISIAKAGIHATLNARTSILAAANPVGGRYDKAKSLKYNVNMSAPIMSRFDLFFVVRDIVNEERDLHLAKHIVRVHRDRDQALTPKYSMDVLRRFIMFARALKPTIQEDARELLITKYKALRQADGFGTRRNGYHITVRQLESLIRLSEAMARANAEGEVRKEHVMAAANLLQKSIIQTEKDDIDLEEEMDLEAAVANARLEDNAAMADGEVDANGEVAQPAAPPKPKLVISGDEYEQIARNVLVWIKEKDERRHVKSSISRREQHQQQHADDNMAAAPMQTDDDAEAAAEEQEEQAVENDSDDHSGISLQELTNIYFEFVQDTIETEEEFELAGRKFHKIIRHMIKKDHSLLPVYASDENDENAEAEQAADDNEAAVERPKVARDRLSADTILMIHPYFNLDSL